MTGDEGLHIFMRSRRVGREGWASGRQKWLIPEQVIARLSGRKASDGPRNHK